MINADPEVLILSPNLKEHGLWLMHEFPWEQNFFYSHLISIFYTFLNLNISGSSLV